MRGPRTQSERDAVTVEIGFAFVTGAALAGLAFLLVTALRGAPLAAMAAAAGVFAARVVHVLVLVRRRQPSQPGRTRPDS